MIRESTKAQLPSPVEHHDRRARQAPDPVAVTHRAEQRIAFRRPRRDPATAPVPRSARPSNLPRNHPP
jgi:hypothetical protein